MSIHPWIVGITLLLTGCAGTPEAPTSFNGPTRELGEGDVRSFAEVDENGAPTVIGVSLSAGALNAPPNGMTDGHRCFDQDADGEIDMHSECSTWYERVLPLPSPLTERSDVPFSWALLNWNNHGHIPPGIWDSPHFDVHFYMAPIEEVFSWQRGPCGPEFMRCDQFEEATRPVAEGYMHPDFIDVKAAAPAMGNHLIDTTAVEFHGEPFTRSWIYGVFGGNVIFYEEMVAQSYLQTRPDACRPIKQPPKVAIPGYYPTETCTRYRPAEDRTVITLEGFEFRNAEPG